MKRGSTTILTIVCNIILALKLAYINRMTLKYSSSLAFMKTSYNYVVNLILDSVLSGI